MLVREVGLVLKIQIGELKLPPEALDLSTQTGGRHSLPIPAINERVGAKGATIIAPDRRDVVELALFLEGEIALNGDEVEVGRRKRVHGEKRPRSMGDDATVFPISRSGDVGSPCSLGKMVNEFGESSLALPSDRYVDAQLRQRFNRKQRRVPTADDGHDAGSFCLYRAKDLQRVANRTAGQHGHAKAQSIFDLAQHFGMCVGRNTRVDDTNIKPVGIEIGANRQQSERHGVEYRHRIVQNDLVPVWTGRTTSRGAHQMVANDLRQGRKFTA